GAGSYPFHPALMGFFDRARNIDRWGRIGPRWHPRHSQFNGLALLQLEMINVHICGGRVWETIPPQNDGIGASSSADDFLIGTVFGAMDPRGSLTIVKTHHPLVLNCDLAL